MPQSSFYADGETYSTSTVTSNDTPGSATPSQAPSSFFKSGGIYNALAEESTTVSLFQQLLASTQAAQAAAASSAAAAAASAASMPTASNANPLLDGTAAPGTANTFARGDHVHPTDTSRASVTYVDAQDALRAPLASPALTGTPTAPTPAALDNTTKLATTAYADSAVGVEKTRALAAEALLAPLSSPALTGTPTAPTAAAGTNTTQLATTAFVLANGTSLGSTTPLMDGTGAAGTATVAARSDHVHPTDTSRAPLASPALTGVPTAPTAANGTNTTQLATTAFVLANGGSGSILRSHLAGLTLSTAGSSTTFSVAPGQATDSTNVDYMTLSSTLSKTTSAWAVGSANGALDTGTIAASTGYHVWLIKRTDTQVVDVLVSLSASAPTMPTSYTEKRRIGWLKTNGSSQWTFFHQNGDEFLWDSPVADASAVSVGTTAVTTTLSVPTGVIVNAICQVDYTHTTSQMPMAIWSPAMATQVAGTPSGNWSIINPASSSYASNYFDNIRTNTSAQIKMVAQAAGGTFYVFTAGWIDRRGRDD